MSYKQAEDLVQINTNELEEGAAYHYDTDRSKRVYWTTEGLKVTRLRLVSDAGFPAWDVSYCHGVLKDGTPVTVQLPFSQIPKMTYPCPTHGYGKGYIVSLAKKEKIFAKGLGILDNDVISKIQA